MSCGSLTTDAKAAGFALIELKEHTKPEEHDLPLVRQVSAARRDRQLRWLQGSGSRSFVLRWP
jgi:hypothetical protein